MNHKNLKKTFYVMFQKESFILLILRVIALVYLIQKLGDVLSNLDIIHPSTPYFIASLIFVGMRQILKDNHTMHQRILEEKLILSGRRHTAELGESAFAQAAGVSGLIFLLLSYGASYVF